MNSGKSNENSGQVADLRRPFFLKFKVFNVSSVARHCSIVPQQDVGPVPFNSLLDMHKVELFQMHFGLSCKNVLSI